MRIHQPVSFKIDNVKSKKLPLKNNAGFYLDIGDENEENDERPWDYFSNNALVCVDLLLGPVEHPKHRLALAFPKRLSSKEVPDGIFDRRTFVEELDCDVGLLFSMISAPQSSIKIKRGQGKNEKLTITLTIGEHYTSQVSVSLKALKPFLKKA